MTTPIRVGMLIDCGYRSTFDHQEYARVEAIGGDWIVVRDDLGRVFFDVFDGAAEDHYPPYVEEPETEDPPFSSKDL